MDIQEWLKSLPGSPTVSQAADYSGVSKATLLRHAKKGQTTAEYAIEIARAYQRNEVQALIDLGIINHDAVESFGIERALEKATNQQILDEILRRSDPEARELFTNDNHPDVIDIPDPDNLEARRERALRLANSGKAAAQKRTPRLEEPESP